MDYDELAGLISYDESGAMTVRREDGTPALNLFESEPDRLDSEPNRQVELAERQHALLQEMLPRVVADVAAFNATKARRPLTRLRHAYRALRGRP